jgi:uncharacterized protein
MNRALGTAITSVACAQAVKVPIAFLQKGQWDWNAAVESGGMPSSHSAGAASLATYTAMKKGMNSIEFAFSAIYALIIMYDAMGIRRHAGEIAVEVNELDRKVEELAHEHPGIYHEKRGKVLEEKLGHVPMEVAGGMLLGAAIGSASFYFEWKRNRLANKLNKLNKTMKSRLTL